MSVLSNNVIAGASIADDAAGDAYQIEKSLRFNKADTPSLQQTVSVAGNRRTFTFSAWVKFCSLQHNIILGQWDNTYDGTRLHVDTGGSVRFQSIESNGSAVVSLISSRVLRDFSGWYHLCVAVDSTAAISSDRVRIYVNGERITAFGTETYPSQNYEFDWNGTSYTRSVGHWRENSTDLSNDAYLADVQHIDGLALSPAAFGSFDSTGVWNPKNTYDDDGKFILPAPNANTTWSSGTITNEHPSYPVSKAFDGKIGTGNDYWGPADGTASFNGFASFEPTNAIEFTTSLRIFADFDTRPATADEPYILVTTDIGGEQRINGPIGGNVSPNQANWKWYTIQEGKGKLTKIKNYQGSLGYWCRIHAIEVDGVILVDGKTDPTERNNPNNGTTWSDSKTTSANTSTSNDTQAFNGTLADGATLSASSQANNSVDYTFTGITDVTKVELYISGIGSNGEIYGRYNATNGTASGNLAGKAAGWYTVYSGSAITLTSVGMILNANSTSGGGSDYVRAFRVNGHILVDSTVDNSFHLKFNDTSLNRYLGKDTFKKISDATGGKPLLATTDDYGLTLGSGNATDSFSSALKFAFAGNNVTGSSLDVSGSGHSCTVTNGTLDTTQSHFYGSSVNFDGDGKIVTPVHSDFDLGTTNWTVEFWSRPSETSSGSGLVSLGDDGTGSTGILIGYNSSGNLQSYGYNTSSWNLYSGKSLGSEKVGVWTHYAITRQGSTFRFFANGVQTDTATHAGDIGQTANQFSIGAAQTGGVGAPAYIHGNIQDFRYYNHGSSAPKYTAAFSPPNRNDFTVNNIDHTGAAAVPALDYSSDLTVGNWDSGNAGQCFDGSTSTDPEFNSSGGNAVFDPDPAIAYSTSVEVHTNRSTTMNVSLNGGSNVAYGGGWTTIHSGSGTLNTLTFSNGNAGNQRFSAIRVDGTILTDTAAIPATDSNIDSLVDTPTNYLPTDGDDHKGGVIRANYATWNPLDNGGATLSEGNLKCTAAGSWNTVRSTISVTSGKWYAEFKQLTGGTGVGFGVSKQDVLKVTHIGNFADSYCYYTNGQILSHNNTYTNYGASYTIGDVIGLGFDYDAGTLTFYKNGTSQGVYTISGGCSGAWSFATSQILASNEVNFGQRAFKYNNAGTDRPADTYKPLCTHHLPDTFSGDELNNPSKYFDVKTYIGDGATKNIKGFGFQPDLTWIKRRNGGTTGYRIFDAIRGATKRLDCSDQNAESTASTALTAFTSDGFTLGADGGVNEDGSKFVSWNWDTGTAAATPSDVGSLDPTDQWVNATAGFSISQYTSTGSSDDTIGHGLNAKPDLIIIKNKDSGTKSWAVYHSAIGATLYLKLDTDDDSGDDAEWWHDTEPTNTVFSIGNWSAVNGTNNKHIVYAWTAIPGYSAFGSFTGNGAAQGPFNYTGFRPKWVLIKADKDASWQIHDTERSTYNGLTANLFPDSTAEEASTYPLDILSNGFLTRDAGSNIQYFNGNGDKIIWAAFAEHPFKTARAR